MYAICKRTCYFFFIRMEGIERSRIILTPEIEGGGNLSNKNFGNNCENMYKLNNKLYVHSVIMIYTLQLVISCKLEHK